MDYHAINKDNAAIIADYVCRAYESGNLDYMVAGTALMVVGAAACSSDIALLRIVDNPETRSAPGLGLETATTLDDKLVSARINGDITIDNIDTP